MRFPLLTTFMPAGGQGKAAGDAVDEHMVPASVDPDPSYGKLDDARHAALARLGFGGGTVVKDVQADTKATVDLRNVYTSVLPPAMTSFAAQYPLTTVAGIGAISTAVLIGTSALTATALRRAGVLGSMARGKGVRKADAEEIKGQLADLERRLSNEIYGLRADIRRVQQDMGSARRLDGDAASFQRIVMTRLDRLDRTFTEMRDRLAVPPSTASLEIDMSAAAEEPPTEPPVPEDAKAKRRKRTKTKAASDPVGKAASAVPEESESSAKGEEEPIMSFADIAEAIKGVQADYATYNANEADHALGHDAASREGLLNPPGDVSIPTTEASMPIAGPTASIHVGETPSIAKAVPHDNIEAELARAIASPEIPHGGALHTIAAELDRPFSESPDPRPVDHSSASPEPQELPRPKGHGTDILYGIDDSGCWYTDFKYNPGELERGWHWLNVGVVFNQHDWAEAIGVHGVDGFHIHRRAHRSEFRSRALHRVHFNPQPELIELDKQIWSLERLNGVWIVVSRLMPAE